MSSTELDLPCWAKVGAEKESVSIVIEADTDGYVREWFGLLGVTEPDQYWLEVAYQCAKLDLQAAIANTPLDPRTCGKNAEFQFSAAPQWALRNYPAGKGEIAATKGLQAREHYKRVRGSLPF